LPGDGRFPALRLDAVVPLDEARQPDGSPGKGTIASGLSE
jgi:hypothetical protein